MNRVELKGELIKRFDANHLNAAYHGPWTVWCMLNGHPLDESSNNSQLLERFVDETILVMGIKMQAFRNAQKLQASHKICTLAEILTGEYFRSLALSNFFDEDAYCWILNKEIFPTIEAYVYECDGGNIDDCYESVFEYAVRQELVNHNSIKNSDSMEILQRSIKDTDFVLINECDSLSKTRNIITIILDQYSTASTDSLKFLLARIATVTDDSLSQVLLKAIYFDLIFNLGELGKEWYLAPVYRKSTGIGPNPSNLSKIITGILKQGSILSMDPFYLDWMLYRMEQYINGGILRLRDGSDQHTAEAICTSYQDYLNAAKPRTPVPDRIEGSNSDGLVEILRRLITFVSPSVGLVIIQNLKPFLTGQVVMMDQWDKHI
tara:strand:+ start:417 stop:1550 length:1134 start_codon:yes stop_codon:yes gene_type:complete